VAVDYLLIKSAGTIRKNNFSKKIPSLLCKWVNAYGLH